MERLLAAVALQKIHGVDGDCVAADGVVVIHSILLLSLISLLWRREVLHYITGMTRLSFPNM